MTTSLIDHLRRLVDRMGEPKGGLRGVIVPQIRPLISIEQFFKGAGGLASMWDNQYPPGPRELDEFGFWRGLRDREDVWDLLICVTQLDFRLDPFEGGNWVHSDHVVIITSALPEIVLHWFPEHAEPEHVGSGWEGEGFLSETAFVPSGMEALWFWYD